MKAKHFTNKKQLALLFGICVLLTVWVFLFKLCIPGRIHWNDVNSLTMQEWFWLGINPGKSLPIFCKTPALLKQYIAEQTINVLGFVPFGILAPFVLKKRWCFLGGFLLILSIEFTQLFARMGGFDVIDMATNMLGLAIGVLLQRFWLGKLHSPTINRLCKIFLVIFVPVAIYALYSLIFIFPTTLPV